MTPLTLETRLDTSIHRTLAAPNAMFVYISGLKHLTQSIVPGVEIRFFLHFLEIYHFIILKKISALYSILPGNVGSIPAIDLVKIF